MSMTIVSTTNAPAAVGPYSQAIKARGLVFVSGQLGLDPATGKFVSGGVEEQARQAISNLEAILKEAGAGLHKVVKTTVLLADMADFAAVNGVYSQCFLDHRPARAAYAVADLPLGGLVEIEAIAVDGD